MTTAPLGLAFVSPFLAPTAIELDSRGSLLFRENSVGRDCEPFEMLKFRTILVGSICSEDELRDLNEANGLAMIAADLRITRRRSTLSPARR